MHCATLYVWKIHGNNAFKKEVVAIYLHIILLLYASHGIKYFLLNKCIVL